MLARRGPARARGRRLPAGRRPDRRSRSPRRSPRSSRPASTAWPPTTGRSSPMRPSWARASRLAGLSAVSGIEPTTLEPRLRALVRRELLTLEADPRSARSAASTPSSRRSSARSPTTRSPSATARSRHLAAARFFESPGLRRAGGCAGRPLPRGPRERRRGPGGRRARRPGADRAAGPPPSGPPPSAPTSRRSRSCDQALTVTTDPAEEADLLERAGRVRVGRGPPRRGRGAPAARGRAASRTAVTGRRPRGRSPPSAGRS